MTGSAAGTAESSQADRGPTTSAETSTVEKRGDEQSQPIPCMDDCCRMAGRCAWACNGRYYVPGGDE